MFCFFLRASREFIKCPDSWLVLQQAQSRVWIDFRKWYARHSQPQKPPSGLFDQLATAPRSTSSMRFCAYLVQLKHSKYPRDNARSRTGGLFGHSLFQSDLSSSSRRLIRTMQQTRQLPSPCKSRDSRQKQISRLVLNSVNKILVGLDSI